MSEKLIISSVECKISDCMRIQFYIIVKRSKFLSEKNMYFSDDSLLDRLSKIAANPFQDWSYTNPIETSSSKDLTDVALAQKTETKPVVRRGRKRIHPVTTPEHEVKRIAIDLKSNKEREDKSEKESKDQIQLQELYYATMEGDKNLIVKESKASLYFKVCSKFHAVVLLAYFIVLDKHISFDLVLPLHDSNEI